MAFQLLRSGFSAYQVAARITAPARRDQLDGRGRPSKRPPCGYDPDQGAPRLIQPAQWRVGAAQRHVVDGSGLVRARRRSTFAIQRDLARLEHLAERLDGVEVMPSSLPTSCCRPGKARRDRRPSRASPARTVRPGTRRRRARDEDRRRGPRSAARSSGPETGRHRPGRAAPGGPVLQRPPHVPAQDGRRSPATRAAPARARGDRTRARHGGPGRGGSPSRGQRREDVVRVQLGERGLLSPAGAPAVVRVRREHHVERTQVRTCSGASAGAARAGRGRDPACASRRPRGVRAGIDARSVSRGGGGTGDRASPTTPSPGAAPRRRGASRSGRARATCRSAGARR